MASPAEVARTWVEKMLAGRRGPDETGFRTALRRCESPIELGYCLSLFQIEGICAVDGDFTPAILPSLTARGRCIAVFAQQPILQYRADFLLIGVSPLAAEPLFVIIECDGAAYHSSREQMRRDIRRQAALRATGFHIVRFTGSEIYSAPESSIGATIRAFAAHGWDARPVPGQLQSQSLRRALAELFQLDT
jgi:very-short-patch-repair endonuclease